MNELGDGVELWIMAWASEGDMKLYMPPESADEVRAMLDEADIQHSVGAEFSAGSDLAIAALHAVTGAGFCGALATVIVAYLGRHKGKAVRIDQETVSVEGYGAKDAERLAQLLQQGHLTGEARWQEIQRSLGHEDRPTQPSPGGTAP